nr:MAG TPA_asm: hypothetical protein [Caudoviricetes sp.]
MAEFTPCRVVLDYDNDQVLFDGEPLPFPLTSIVAQAAVADGRATVTLVLEVDEVLSVAEKPKPADDVEQWTAAAPEQMFEDQLDAIRKSAQRRA